MATFQNYTSFNWLSPLSDNIIRPEAWVKNGQVSLSEEAAPSGDDVEVALGGDGPHDPGVEARVTALETDMKEIKGSLGRLEVSVARVEATLANLATRADMATATERIASLDGRTTTMETAINDTVKSALGKAIGPWQLPMVLAACCTIFVLLAAGLGWISHQTWFKG